MHGRIPSTDLRGAAVPDMARPPRDPHRLCRRHRSEGPALPRPGADHPDPARTRPEADPGPGTPVEADTAGTNQGSGTSVPGLALLAERAEPSDDAERLEYDPAAEDV